MYEEFNGFTWGTHREQNPQYHVGDEEGDFPNRETAFDEARFWAQHDANKKGVAQNVYALEYNGSSRVLVTLVPIIVGVSARSAT
jgi:hypothetical protein